MKFYVPLLLLLLFDTLQGSTLPHVRKVRALNTTLQTNFNGTYERRNPCTNAAIESSSYVASHEFHHHTSEDNWSDYTHKCSAIISGFLQAIGNLVRFNNKQNGLFNFHINTSISQKQVDDHKPGTCCESMPTILIEATDCEVTPKTQKNIAEEVEEKAVTEGKYDGPVCLLNNGNKPAPVTVTVSGTAYHEQNADTINPPVKISNLEIPQNEVSETDENQKEVWNPIKTSFGDTCEPSKVEYSQTVPNGIAQSTKTTYGPTSTEFETPTTPLPETEYQVIPVTTSYESSQPKLGAENSQGFQTTVFENANEPANFNPPATTANVPFTPQPSFNGIVIPPQVLSIANEEVIIRNRIPPALPQEQGLPAVYPQQPSNENLDEQVPGSLPREPLPNSYPNQMPVVLPPYQTQGNLQEGPGYPQNSPASVPPYNGQNSNLEFSGNYPPAPEQAPPMKTSFELPPPEVGLTETQAPGQIPDMTQTFENNFTPDQQQTITPEKAETVYYNDQPMNYDQIPTTPSPEIQPEFLPTKPLPLLPESQQKFSDYPSEIARNEQPPMKSVEVPPPDSVDPKEAVFSDSLIIPNGGVSAVANSFQPVTQPDSQLPVAPVLTAPQENPLEQPPTIPPPVESTGALVEYQKVGIPLYHIPPNTNQISEPSQISNNPPVNSFSNQLAPNNLVQLVPTSPSTVDNISPPNNFPEQPSNKFDAPQQTDSIILIPLQTTTPQPIPTLEPQPSPDFSGQLSQNNMFVPQNFQNNVPVDVVPLKSPAVIPPASDIIHQTAVEGSQVDYPSEKTEPPAPELVPENVGNQLSDLRTYDKPVLNSNDFQPETQSFSTEPSDRNLDYTTQTPFYDSVPATYKSEPESQPGLISSVQNSSELPTAPPSELPFPPYGSESFSNTPPNPELPSPTPDVTKTESYSEQTRPEFASTPTNPEFVNPPRNDFQTVAPRPGPQFMPPEQTLAYDRDTIAMQQSNLAPEISNPLNTNQPPVEINPVLPVQQQPQFYSNQNGDIQQPLPESALTPQTSVPTVTQQEYETTGPETNKLPDMVPLQYQPITPVYPQPPVQSDVLNYDVQPSNQPPAYPEGKVFPQNEFYTESPQNEEAVPQSVLPYQPPNVQIQSAESQGQLLSAETTSAEFTPNTNTNSPPAAPEAGDSFPKESLPVEQQSAGFDGPQMSQQNYFGPGFQNRQVLPVDLPATQVPASQSLSGQSDSNLNYDRVQPNGMLQPEPRAPDQFSFQPNSNLQPVTLPPQTGPMNSQSGVNPNELQTNVPFASSQQTDIITSPLPPLQTVPENSQVSNFPQSSAFGSTVPTTTVSDEGMDKLMLNSEQPSGFSQSERQDPNTYDQFPSTVPPQFTTQSPGEATTVKPNPYQPQPSEAYFGGDLKAQSTKEMLTPADEYQGPVMTTQEPLNYFQERPYDVAQTTPPPFQADQFLTSSQPQSEYVQNNPATYSPNLAPRPQPQPSFDNLTEFPGDKTAGSITQTPSPSEIKPETLGSQPLSQTALAQTNVPDTDNTKTLDAQPKSEYLGPQIYPNSEVVAPAVNYPIQDTRSFPSATDSITRDMTYQTTNPIFAPSQAVPTFGINPMQTGFNSSSSYFSTTMPPSEGLETQPFRQASDLIASPQPQSTTVKYNEQIIIPQNQMPTASNPQPQPTLKYSDRYSGDNTKGGLPDSVPWTFSGPQEAMRTTPSPQYQTNSPGPQFPQSNAQFINENKDFRLAQKELVPVTQASLTPTPSSEQQGDSSEGKPTTIVEEIITTAMPMEMANSSVEDQLAFADKLLNSSAPLQENYQTTEQKPQAQQIQSSPTKTTVVTEYFVTPSTPFQRPLEIQNQPQIQSSSSTNSGEIETGSPVSTPSPYEQEIEAQPQPQLQSFTPTNIREVTADSFVSPPPSFQPQIGDQSQLEVQSLPSTNMRETRDGSPTIPPQAFRQQIDAQPQMQPQPFSSTISREIATDSLVSQPPPFQPHVEDQPQSKLVQLDPTYIREDETVPPATAAPSLQQQVEIQSQPQLQPFSLTNIKEVTATTPVVPASPYPQQMVVQPQPEFQYPTTITREELTAPPVTTPPLLQQQIDAQPQPQLQSFTPTNMREITDASPVTPSATFPQQIQVQPQMQPQPFSSTISRETVTDSLVSPPPPFQPQTENEPKLQLQSFPSTITREGTADSPVTASSFYQQQIDDVPQTQLQPISSTTSREVVTDSLVSSPPPIPQEIQNQFQPQVEEFVSTNFRKEMAVSSVTPPPPFQPQIQVQHQKQFQIISSTNSREGITDSPVTSSTPFPGQTDDLPQTQLTPLSSTISREIVINSLVRPPPPFQPQTDVHPLPQLQSFPSTNMREIITDSPVTTPTSSQQQTVVQPETDLDYSTKISREVITDSLVTPPPLQQMEVLTQPQPPSINTREVMTHSPDIPPPPPIQQQTADPQPFYPTISREPVTDSFVNQPSPLQPQTEDQIQPQPEGFYTTNIREDTLTPSVTPPPPFQQQTEVQSQTEPQPFPSTISREAVTDSFVSQPPPFQSQTEDLPQPQPEGFYTTNIREDTITPSVTPPQPFQQQTEVQSQTEPQPFSSTISREAVTDSFVSQPPPFQSQTEDQPQPQLVQFGSTDIGEDKTVPLVTAPPPFQQQSEVQSQTEPQPFSSTISRETVTVSTVSQSPSFQPQIEDQPKPQPEELYTTNIREDTITPSVTPPPLSQQQTEVQSQTELQDHTTITKEDVTVPPVTPSPLFQQQTYVELQPRFQSFPSSNVTGVTTDSLVPPPPFEPKPEVQIQPKLDSTNITEVVTEPPLISPPVLQHQIDVQPQIQPQSFSSTISNETVTDSLVSGPPPIESQSEPQLLASSSPNTGDTTTVSPVSQSPLVLQQLENQTQPQLQSFSSRNPRRNVTDSLVSPSPPLPRQKEVELQPELKSFSSTNSSAHLQRDVETQRQRDLRNFPSRNTTEAVSDSQVSASASLQGARGQVQNQVHAFSAANSLEVAADSLVNPAAKLEKHIAQEYQTQRVRYTTTSTKEVITESFLPTSESTYVESGEDGQLKSIEIRSDSEGNSSHGKKVTEVVEEIIATDFPPITQFSSLEDEFAFAEKLLNDSTPVLKTTSFVNISPLEESTVKKVVTTVVEIQKPVDQISVNTTSENAVPLSKSTRVNYDQVLPTQAPRESDEVVASNPNNQTTSPRADRQSTFKSDLRPTYGPTYSQSGLANNSTTVAPLGSYRTASPDFQTSKRKVLFKSPKALDQQGSSHLNPLLQTLETHLNFPLHEPPELSSSKPGPRREYPLPLLSRSNLHSRQNKTMKEKSRPVLLDFQNSEKPAQETKSAPLSDPPVPVSNTTDPSNGPDPLKVLKNSSADKMAPASSGEN